MNSPPTLCKGMAEALRDDKIQILFECPNSDELAFVWRPRRVLEPTLSRGALRHFGSRVRDDWRFCSYRRRHWRGSHWYWISPFLAAYAREVGAQALHSDHDSAFFFKPLVDGR